jgi:hypothetical protein
MPNIVEEIPCKTFDEFLEKLRPSNDIWDESVWVFRGHENSSYDLLPTLFRPNSSDILIKNHHEKLYNDFQYNGSKSDQIVNSRLRRETPNGFESMVFCNIERLLIYNFARMANDAGLPIPDLLNTLQIMNGFITNFGLVTPAIGELAPNVPKIAHQNSPSFEPNEAIALAQHHGIPTRLLDFTTDPLRALYFASNHGESDEICVWAIKLHLVNISHKGAVKMNRAYNQVNDLFSEYGLLEVATANNEYLKSQKGLFLYPKYPFEYYTLNGRFPSLIDFIEGFYGQRDQQMGFRPLRKITLPRNQVPELRAKIRKEQISLTRLMPSLDNIKNDMVAEVKTPFRDFKFLWQRFDVDRADTLIQGYSVRNLNSMGDLKDFCKFKKQYCPVGSGYRLYFGFDKIDLPQIPNMRVFEPGIELTTFVKAVYCFNKGTGRSELYWYVHTAQGSNVLETLTI